MASKISLEVNGAAVEIAVDDPAMPLLYALRNDLALKGPRFGCGLGQCGACTVIIDGEAVRSCVTTLEAAAGRKVTTLEGLGSPERPHPIQAAFIEHQAAQCGYCSNGMIMQAKAFLDRNKRPSDGEIRQALADNLCRCGTHIRVLAAIKLAAERIQRG
ncbi:MAG: (2Fe-2S)-binding protein [Proteobacteria bacterium]|nr:(2Fe-2S)-binding protein [Pseudomonadota bacterium]MBI3498625.1 (2Fe-2S)-binding protein [Pseudomonadota bacterium]